MNILPENTCHGDGFGWLVLSRFSPCTSGKMWALEEEKKKKKNPELKKINLKEETGDIWAKDKYK